MFSEEEYILKGWSEEDIKKTKIALAKMDSKSMNSDNLLLWVILLIVILGNIIFALVTFPLQLINKPFIIYSTTIILGLILGTIYIISLNSFENIKAHRIFTNLIVPLFIFLSFFSVLVLFGGLENLLHKTFLQSAVYTFSFMIPYYIWSFY